MPESRIPAAQDKLLFTPGPLTTSRTIKQAMLCDLGSRDTAFIEVISQIRSRLLGLSDLSQQQGYEAILMQGSGTFSIESVLSSAIPPETALLVVVNGAYGKRIVAIAERYGIETVVVESSENETPDVEQISRVLAEQPEIGMVAAVHCETTSGIMNPIAEIGRAAHEAGKIYFVDSMSAFGAVPVDFADCNIDYLVSSANKCIEGVPGFGFVICRRETLEASDGWARTVSLDLLAQWRGLEKNGQFRFTPPTHALLAFYQALVELEEEGGVLARGQRYRENYDRLIRGTRRLGLEEYVPEALQGTIITSFRYPDDPMFDFEQFYEALSKRGYVIYPGKVTNADCFRIGNIGRIFPEDVDGLLRAMREVFSEMGVAVGAYV